MQKNLVPNSCNFIIKEIERVYPSTSKLRHIDQPLGELLDSGAYGDIYMHNDHIIKVYTNQICFSHLRRRELLWTLDETIGSIQLKYGLIPTDVVWISSLQKVGLIKPYISSQCPLSHYIQIENEIGVINTWDCCRDQFRIDQSGNFKRVDTQTILAAVITDLRRRRDLDNLFDHLIYF